MRKLVLMVSAWLVVGTAADVRADRLFATHFSIWGKSKITELDPQTGAVLNSYPPPATPNQQAGLAFDGSHLYFLSGRIPTYNTIYKLDPDTGAVVGQYDLPDNPTRTGLAILGGFLYASDRDPHQNNIEVYDLASGAYARTIRFRDANPTAALMIDWGLGAIRDPDGLLATARVTGSPVPAAEIVELDPATGVIQDRFEVLYEDLLQGTQGLAAVGDEIFLGLHVTREGNQIIVYNRDGVEQRRFGVSGSTGVQALAAGPGVIPEPSTFVLLGTGAVGLLAWIRRRRKM